jgi:hypothetical protein
MAGHHMGLAIVSRDILRWAKSSNELMLDCLDRMRRDMPQADAYTVAAVTLALIDLVVNEDATPDTMAAAMLQVGESDFLGDWVRANRIRS